MMARMTRALRTVATAAAALAVTAGAAETASARTAHETTTHQRFAPPRAADATAMAERTIRLRGRYTWIAFSKRVGGKYAPRPVERRALRLRGRYIWRDWIVVKGKGYRHYSTLTNARTGGRVTNSQFVPPRIGTGWITWGTTLHNDRSGQTGF